MKTHYRILWPRTDNLAPKESKDISHWIVAADDKHRPINYGCAHFAFFNDGRIIEGFFKYREF
jgi:hypothetical protein